MPPKNNLRLRAIAPEEGPGKLEYRNSVCRSRKNFISSPGKTARNPHCPWFLFQMPILLEGGHFSFNVFLYIYTFLLYFKPLMNSKCSLLLILGYSELKYKPERNKFFFWPFHSLIAADHFQIVIRHFWNCELQAAFTFLKPLSCGGSLHWMIGQDITCTFLIFLCTYEYLSYEMIAWFWCCKTVPSILHH